MQTRYDYNCQNVEWKRFAQLQKVWRTIFTVFFPENLYHFSYKLHYVMIGNMVFFSVQKFLFVAKFFSVYLSHVRVADYTVTHLTRSKVKDLMADTQSKVLTPLVELIVNDKVCVYYLIMVFCIDLENFNLKYYRNYQIQFYFPSWKKFSLWNQSSAILMVKRCLVVHRLMWGSLLYFLPFFYASPGENLICSWKSLSQIMRDPSAMTQISTEIWKPSLPSAARPGRNSIP